MAGGRVAQAGPARARFRFQSAQGWMLVGLLFTCVAGLLGTLWATSGEPRPQISREFDRLTLAKVAVSERRWVRAEELLRTLYSEGSGSRDIRALLGRVLIERGRLEEGRSLFTGLLKERPEDPEALRGMASALRGLGQLELAILHLERALRGAAEDPSLWRELGFLQRERGDALGALSSLQKALSLDGGQSDLPGLMAELATGKQDPLGLGAGPGMPKPIDLSRPAVHMPLPRVPDPMDQLPKPARGLR